jgi:hypothetical protein
MLNFTSAAAVNSMYWICSLKESEKGTTLRVLEDLEPFLISANIRFKYYEPNSADDLKNVLADIAAETKAGAKPLIHLDTHGSRDDGVVVAATQELVSWQTICSYLREINILSGNNLCVMSAACFSYHLLYELEIDEATPFFILIAPQDMISFGFTEDNTLNFYKAVFSSEDLIETYEKYLRPQMSLYHSEKMLAIVIGRYFKQKCLGKGGRERKEDLVSKAIALGTPNTRFQRRRLRKAVKEAIRPTPQLIEKYAATFLVGKPLPFSFSDFMDLVRKTSVNDRRT